MPVTETSKEKMIRRFNELIDEMEEVDITEEDFSLKDYTDDFADIIADYVSEAGSQQESGS